MDKVTAAQAELAQTSPLVRHDFQTSLQLQDLINQGEAALISLYKHTSYPGSTQLANASNQVEGSLDDAPGAVNPCTQLVSNFCTAAACGLQLVYAGALAPDATTLKLCAETQRNVLRLLDLLHVMDVLKHSLCLEAPKPEPLETATEEASKPGASGSALQIAAAAVPAGKGTQCATATLSESCADISAHSPVAAMSDANGKASAGTTSGVPTSPAAAGPAVHQSTASEPGKCSVYPDEEADAATPSRAVPSAAAVAAASQSAAAGSGKGSSYPLSSLEVWGAQWGAVRLACRKLAAVPHQHRVSACLAVHAQEALWASDKVQGVGFLLPEERLALLRALPAALFLLFSSEDNEAQALEALGGPKALMKCLQLLRARPVAAAFGERQMSLLALLQASPYLSSLGAELGKEWIIRSPQDLQGKHLAAVVSSYKLSGAVSDVRNTHAALSANMTSLAIRMEECGARQAPIPLQVVTKAMVLTESSLKSLSSWAQLLLDSHSWQQHNPEDLTAMLEIMACLQGLAGQLLGEQAWLAPLLQQAVRAQAQHVANTLSAAIEKPSLPRKVLDAADAVRAAIIGWSGAALRQRPQPPAHRSSRLRGLAASVMRASGQQSSLHELAAGASSIGPPGTGEGVLYGMGTAGPTDLQRHTLVCALEALLKEAQPSGMGGLIRRGPLGDSLTKELSAFHASVLRWPHLLDLPTSVKQASSMASLGLQQCCISAPSDPGPGSGVPPLPLQLIRHALGPLNGCSSADLCLAPLAVYIDTATLCRERLGSGQMAHAAEQAANAAVELLLDLLSHAVFSHAKQKAEASLRGLDNADRSAGEAAAPDHFQALLRRPGVQLPAGAASLRAGLVPRLQRLLASDAADLAGRLADSDCPCATLPELEYRVQVLERAHTSMAASLALAPWTSIWSQPRASQQEASSADRQMSHPDRITEHATDAILKLVTSEKCTYDSRSRRFVLEGTPEAVEPLPMQQKLQAASGSGTPRYADLNGDQTATKAGAHAIGSSIAGSKGVGAVSRDSLGDAEMAAFMRLCGPGGVAHLAAALAQEAGACVTECFVAMSGAAGALPADVICAVAEGPAELYAMLTDVVTQAAGSEDAHSAVRALHAVGGALLALMRMEACISTHSVAQFMVAAPLLGITPDERGALTQPGAGEVTPIAGALFEACAEQRLAHVSASSDAAAALQTANSLLQQAEEGCWRALEPPHLLPTFLEGLRTELSSVLTVSPTLETPPPVPLALSALLFALATPDLGIAVPVQAPFPDQPVFAASPILPTVSRSADSSSELIAAVHCEAELEGTPREQHVSIGAPGSASLGTTRTSQGRWGEERQANGTAANATNGLLGGVSVRPDEDEGVGVANGAEISPQRLRICGGDEMDLPAGTSESGAESPTRPQAAERMDDAIQQGLQLWTPPKVPNSGETPEHATAADSQQVVSSVGRSLEPPESPVSEADQASSTVAWQEKSSQGATPGASADEVPTEQHSARTAGSEGAPLHQQKAAGVLHDHSVSAADSPVPELPISEAAPGSCPGPSQEQSLPVMATGTEVQASTALTSHPPEEQQEIGGEDAPSDVSEAGQVLDSIELDGAEDTGKEGQGSGSQQVASGIGGSNGLAAQQAEQPSGRRKWKFKLGRAARASDAPTAVEASSQSEVAEGGTPRKGGFRKQLARFGRSKGASPSASISDEAPSSAPVADAAVQASAAVKGKAAAVEDQPAALLNTAEEIVQQSSGSIDVRRSQSEAAAGIQPAKKGFLKKQLTRFGRARGVSEGASSAGEGMSASSGTERQPGAGKSQSAWIPVLGMSRSPKCPAEKPGSSDADKEEQVRLRWPEVGDAPLWGAALLVWLLQLQPDFQLQDICRRLLVEADLAGRSESAMSESVLHGLANLRKSQGVVEEALSSISSQCLS
ncbi:probable protein pirA at N-terminal half [Coccomyxa sp. Obi]|nr:probable protein pirA at N-terminal half [Coccomyxa sp. Obi]